MIYRGRYRSGMVRVTTRGYASRELAWQALVVGLRRRGIEPGPWHRPGTVCGDCGEVVSRANGAAWLESKEVAS